MGKYFILKSVDYKNSTSSKKKWYCTACVSVITFLMALPVQAAIINETVENALLFGEQGKYGQVTFDLRYRYEYVHITDDSPIKTAIANTMRLRFGYLTPEFHGLQVYAEYEGNLSMQDDYNSLRNGKTNYEVVADPQEQELNQFWLSYKGIPNTLIKGGRQVIALDNQRFIGNIAWRQMEQTFDSVVIQNKSIKNLTLNIMYIGQVQTVTSIERPITMPVFNFTYKFGRFSTLTGYGYWLADYAAAVNSTQTYGVRMHGTPKLIHDIQLHYDVGYSNQSDYKNNPGNYGLDRYNIILGASYVGVSIQSGVEQLDGNGSYAFQTPLGTKHLFQGWADKFLVTPVRGVRDIKATIDKSFYGVKLLFAYHNFTESSGSGKYGNEYDFLLSKHFGKHYQILAKYAYYDASNSQAAVNAGVEKNTQKIWVQGRVTF
ncbi:MAG: alginate export family protein [Gammaproteobacteria bacterium]|nr:alginate export family protein [Gammaproteobacteria bacterium]